MFGVVDHALIPLAGDLAGGACARRAGGLPSRPQGEP